MVKHSVCRRLYQLTVGQALPTGLETIMAEMGETLRPERSAALASGIVTREGGDAEGGSGERSELEPDPKGDAQNILCRQAKKPRLPDRGFEARAIAGINDS
jgi:hypothetical protein